ncbi:MAG: type I-E CRISPR-associated protein Cse2/CasB [Lentisphaerae bacterium]|nr:type I-E CRISPR-associated protein Cse2/CasB [Lentisphaerota bacterium]
MNAVNDKNATWTSIVLAWWKELENDRGERARLRRCGDVTEVFFCPAFHDLVRRLRTIGGVSRETVAVTAGVLAHVKENVPAAKVAAQMAEGRGDRAAVSELRFRRLIETKDREALFIPLIRLVALMDGKVNVGDLTEGIRFWGPRARRDWACDYYEPAPGKKP